MKTAVVIGGVAALALAGAAAARIRDAHELALRLPDGSTEHIWYAGSTPPRVRIEPDLAGLAPTADPFGTAPFAALDRIAAQMDRETAAMMRWAEAAPAFGAGDGLTRVDLGRLPPGARGYTSVTTIVGGKACTRTTEYLGDAATPKVMTRTSGDCSALSANAPPAPAAVAPATARAPEGVMQTSWRTERAF
ncbi:MAG TPA: hypothetical protein VGS12_06745 [Caulobacteraceae bacterium]|nr:hypothetical protein [Caulobacteraceae bacterium]